jgi:hypothetical protein
MSDNTETLRDVFAGMCALALIMRGIPDDAVPTKSYEMADRLMEARDPDPVGLPAIKRRKSK